MPTIKIANIKPAPNTISANSYDVSSSVSGNMKLIQEQINQKTNDYINIKNAVNLLEKYSNWNGYIKLYTEVENNFNSGDTVYITYTESGMTSNTFNLDNYYNSTIDDYYNSPFDTKFPFGYKVLYVDRYKNELVINRYYNDITPGYSIKNQCLSKVSCRGGDFLGNTSDGVVFFNCNVLNGKFGKLEGVVSGVMLTGATSGITTLLSNATVMSVGLFAETDINGFYSLTLPTGSNTIKFHHAGYITNTIISYINVYPINTLNVTLTGGTNSVSIVSNMNTTCLGGTVTFSASTIGYAAPITYQWKLTNSGGTFNVGSNNYIFAYNTVVDGDLVKCEVRDDIDILDDTYSVSNEIEINIIPRSITITNSPTGFTYQGQTITFSAFAPCENTTIYQWKVNNIIVTGITSSTFSTNALNNGDSIICGINGLLSNTIIVTVLPVTSTTTSTSTSTSTTSTSTSSTSTTTTTLPASTSTTTTSSTSTTTTTLPLTTSTTTTSSTSTTTTTLPLTTTLAPTTTLIPPAFFELFGQLYNL